MMTQLIVGKLAEERGFNISTLAQEARLAYTTAWALWHGSAKLLSMDSLERIAVVLEVNVSDLFEGKPNPDAIANVVEKKKNKAVRER